MLSKKIIFLTGATGTMGEEGLKQILSRSDRFNPSRFGPAFR